MNGASGRACSDGLIAASGVTKDYGGGRGLFNASLRVDAGEVAGFLGANGAGKTVTMRILMGFVRADQGHASLCGYDCFEDRVHAQACVGYLPGEVALPGSMRAQTYLDYLARVRGLGDTARRDALVERFELDESQRIKDMSKGTKQKVAIVSAFMGGSRVLLLDEPTSGLDPLMQARFDELVLEERDRGAAILMSSHVFSEVERVCDRVVIVRSGHVTPPVAIREAMAGQTRSMRVRLASVDEAQRLVHGECTEAGAGVQWKVRAGEGPCVVDVDVTGRLSPFIRWLSEYEVLDLETRERRLEDLFMRFYTDELSGDNQSRSAIFEKRRQ